MFHGEGLEQAYLPRPVQGSEGPLCILGSTIVVGQSMHFGVVGEDDFDIATVCPLQLMLVFRTFLKRLSMGESRHGLIMRCRNEQDPERGRAGNSRAWAIGPHDSISTSCGLAWADQ